MRRKMRTRSPARRGCARRHGCASASKPDLTSPLAEHARANRLGMPVTQVFSVGTVEVQGFMGGIVYMQRGRKETVAVIPW
ncbi:MAG: hypothetical protein R2838_12485 [Caldilineaceae bacterium]